VILKTARGGYKDIGAFHQLLLFAAFLRATDDAHAAHSARVAV
jgi:hypothetical protein